jgi:SAM-dependent methyltransferase
MRSADPQIEAPDWEAIYRQGTPPWDTGRPNPELLRLLDEKVIRRCSVLEIGCGTGADCCLLAKRGFEVTAVDVSPIAIERARGRAEQVDALLRFVQADIMEFGQTAGQFDLIYEAGFYHCVRQYDLERFLDMLWRVTRPGSLYLSLCGASGEKAEGGPPQVSRDDIHNELGRLFEFVEVRPFRFASPARPEGFSGWSCLMRRPALRK